MTTKTEVSDVATVFVNEPSSHLNCLLCNSVYTDPVINISCGHTFCRQCATTANGSSCPSDNSPINASQLVTNRLVVGQIDDLQIYCRHGFSLKDGKWNKLLGSCTTFTTLGSREEHENTCPFAPVSCPNSEQCGSVRSKDLERHLSECVRTPCKYKNLGCNYRGTPNQVNDHTKVCLHREGHHNNGALINTIHAQDTAIKSIQTENVNLLKRVTELEETKDQMAAQLEKQNGLIQTLSQRLDYLTMNFEKLLNNRTRPQSVHSSQMSLADSGITRSVTASTRLNLGSPTRLGTPRLSENWEMPFQFKCMGTYRGHRDVVWSMTTKRGRLYSGCADGIIKVWSLEELAKGCINNIQAHDSVVHCLTTWSDRLLSGSADLNIRMWDLNSNQLVGEIKTAHDNAVCSMVRLDDILFSSSFSSIKVWNLKNVTLQANFTGMDHWVRALAVGHDKDKLYSGSHNAIHIWDIKDKYEKAATIEYEMGSVYALAVNANYIVAGTSGPYEENIQIYHIDTHERVNTLQGHIGTVTTLLISPSGRFMFSASQDSTIQVWNLDLYLCIHSLSRHQGSVNTLTLHGDYLLSGSEDHEIKIFRYFQITATKSGYLRLPSDHSVQ